LSPSSRHHRHSAAKLTKVFGTDLTHQSSGIDVGGRGVDIAVLAFAYKLKSQAHKMKMKYTKMHNFHLEFYQIFCEAGTAPSSDFFPGGEETTFHISPSSSTSNNLDSSHNWRHPTFAQSSTHPCSQDRPTWRLFHLIDLYSSRTFLKDGRGRQQRFVDSIYRHDDVVISNR